MDDVARAMGAGALATVLTDLDAQLGFSHDLTLIKKTQAFRTKYVSAHAGIRSWRGLRAACASSALALERDAARAPNETIRGHPRPSTAIPGHPQPS